MWRREELLSNALSFLDPLRREVGELSLPKMRISKRRQKGVIERESVKRA